MPAYTLSDIERAASALSAMPVLMRMRLNVSERREVVISAMKQETPSGWTATPMALACHVRILRHGWESLDARPATPNTKEGR